MKYIFTQCGTVMQIDLSELDCPLIEVAGSPRERGRQYGEQAKERILKGIAHYTEQLRGDDLEQSDLDSIIATFSSSIEAYGSHYVQEIRGIAEAAGVDANSIFLINTRTEVLKIARRRKRGLPDFIEPDGCTGVIVLPQAAKDGNLIHAQNWDWKTECAQTAVVLKVNREDGPSFITFTEAGGLARTGFNSAGVSISGNYLESDRDYRQAGVPLSIIRRAVLEQRHLAHAMRAVYATPKSASNNMMIGQVHGIAIDFECAPDETFQVHAEEGLVVHANHFQSPVALAKLLDKGVAGMPDSLYRDLRVRDLIRPALGAATTDIVKAALFDDFESPWSVCRPPRESLGNNQSATVAMIVMVPAKGHMEVALLPAINPRFQAYALQPDIAPVKAARISKAA